MSVIAIDLIMSRSLLDEPAFDSAAYIAHACERAAHAHMDDDGTRYTYRYLSPDVYEYSPGPFDYRCMPGDIPEHAVLIIGRVGVEQKA